MGKVLYSAIVLDNESHQKILDTIHIPEGWKTYAHHMTLSLSQLPEEWKNRIGEKVILNVDKVGSTDKAMALRVSNFERLMPGTPHITVAVDWENGGRPKDSNQIKDWTFKIDLSLTGTIQEVKAN